MTGMRGKGYRSIYVWAAMLLCLLGGCRHQSKPLSVHHAANVDYQQLFAKLKGTWVSYEYILNLRKTQSPSHSAAFSDGVFSFMIDPSHLKDDTLLLTAWVNNHEERGLWIAFDSPDSLGRYAIGIHKHLDVDAEQRSQLADNIIRIKIDSPFLTVYTAAFDSVRYIYYDSVYHNRSSDYPLKYYTTSSLFRGYYYTRDSGMIFGNSMVYFDPQVTGRIYGSAVYDSFDININTPSPGDTTDYMEFFDSRKVNESRSFVYKFRKNILNIYTNIDSQPCILNKVELMDTLPINLHRP